MTKQERQEYGRRLQHFRERQHLSRDAVGRALGYTASSARCVVRLWERGERFPHVYNIRDLMALYKVDAVADLLPISTPPAPAQTRERNISTRD